MVAGGREPAEQVVVRAEPRAIVLEPAGRLDDGGALLLEEMVRTAAAVTDEVVVDLHHLESATPAARRRLRLLGRRATVLGLEAAG